MQNNYIEYRIMEWLKTKRLILETNYETAKRICSESTTRIFKDFD
jgi:hypothetical protein